MKCKNCSLALVPQQRHCPSCKSVQSPWFNRLMPWLLCLLAVAAFVGSIFGGIDTDELGQAMAVMIPVSVAIITTSIGLFRGSKIAWYVWTILLGLLVFGCTATLIGEDGGPFPLLFLIPTIVYVAVALRTNDKKRLDAATAIYSAVIVLIAFIVMTKAIAIDISALALMLPTAGLIIWTYSIPVRWWYNISQGQFGKQIENTTGDKDYQEQSGSPADDTGNDQPSISYTEKDNLGTRHDSKSISLAYWMGERMNSTRKDPFVMFTFKDKEFAEAALLELPCIQVASDSKKLICTERLIFGYYAIEDVYEAILCGDALTIELFDQAKASFSKYGGEMKNELAPTQHATITPKTQASQSEKVVYVREDRQSGIGGTAIYRVHKGPDEQSAMAFLKENPVTQDLLYLVVETPEGNFCRDKMGIYKED